MKEVTCPVDGCTYSGLPDSVAGHYGGSQDNAHSGNFSDCMSLLDTEPPVDSEAAQSAPEAGGEQSGTNPLKEGPPVDESVGSADADECPECGVTGDTSAFDDGDRIECEGCGTLLIYNE